MNYRRLFPLRGLLLLFGFNLTFAQEFTTRYANNQTVSGKSAGLFLLDLPFQNGDSNQNRWNIDSSIKYNMTSSDFEYSLAEFYLGNKRTSQTEIFGGRKILTFSQQTQSWYQDKLTPLRRFTLLDHQQEGRFGVHLEWKNKDTKWKAYLSPVHIPSNNPSLSVENGKVSTTSDWEVPPQDKIAVASLEVPVWYELKRPASQEFWLRPSIGASLEQEVNFKEIPALEMQFAPYFLWSPENTVRINGEAFYNDFSERVEVIANPYINQQLVLGLNFKNTLNMKPLKLHLNFEYQYTDPNTSLTSKRNISARNFESSLFAIASPLEKEKLFLAEFKLEREMIAEMEVGFLKYFSDHQGRNDILFGSVVKWDTAIRLSGKYYFSDYVTAQMEWMTDFVNKDQLTTGQLDWNTYKNMNIHAGLQTVRSPNTDSYWSNYRTEDIIFSGITLRY